MSLAYLDTISDVSARVKRPIVNTRRWARLFLLTCLNIRRWLKTINSSFMFKGSPVGMFAPLLRALITCMKNINFRSDIKEIPKRLEIRVHLRFVQIAIKTQVYELPGGIRPDSLPIVSTPTPFQTTLARNRARSIDSH